MSAPNPRHQVILELLMEDGTLTVRQLMDAAGWTEPHIPRGALAQLMSKALVQRVDVPRTNPAVYGLTKLGIERAIELAAAGTVAEASGGTTGAEQQAAAQHGWALAAEESAPSSGAPAVPAPATHEPAVVHADALVCAINSRGELALDFAVGPPVQLPPAQALALKRFLDNTSVLEELAAGGSL